MEFSSDIFWHDENGDIDYCRTYPLFNNHTLEGQCKSSDFNISSSDKDQLKLCDPDVNKQEITYGEFGMDSTAATQFNLVCDDQYKVFIFM